MSRLDLALHLPGGGLTGALYQIGALAALEDGVEGFSVQDARLFVGAGSGATVASALAGGVAVDRMYRALLDPADNFFPLERGHVAHFDFDEWRRTLETGWIAVRHALARIRPRSERVHVPAHVQVLDHFEGLNDSLPAGLFKLDKYERFLAEFFLRRGVPNSLRVMPRALRITAYDVDSGERVVFGEPGHDDVPTSLACAASLALPLFFSPVRVGGRHYLDGGLGRVAHLDVAQAAGVKIAVVVNPLVPVWIQGRVPTGHGVRASVRDKGLLWLYNQSMRIGAHERVRREVDEANRRHASGDGATRVLLLEPRPTDAQLFLHGSTDHAARRAILEYAYRTTRERLDRFLAENEGVLEAAGISPRPAG